MKVYGDLFEIESGFLTLLDYKLQYPDIYLIYVTNENGQFIDDFIGEKAWFIDENCWVWETIEQLSSIMMFTGADSDVTFWEDDD